jgi:hypothetical protein
MYTATVTCTATATSLRDLMNTALGAAGPEVPAIYSGRAMQVILIPSAATVILSSRNGTPPANNGVALVANIPISFQAASQNQLSIDEMFLSGVGTVGVIVIVN